MIASTSFVTIYVVFVLLLSRPATQAVKQRFVYPRIGYVSFPEDAARPSRPTARVCSMPWATWIKTTAKIPRNLLDRAAVYLIYFYRIFTI